MRRNWLSFVKVTRNIKRRALQIVAFGFSNAYAGNFLQGKIYKGTWKQICNPGLNCYSCPAATTSCPIGAMQTVAGSIKFDFSFYATGFILALGVIFGRAICGNFCPFGFLQELLYKIPFPKLKLKKCFTYVKYVLLVLFVLILPFAVTNVAGAGEPFFCQYICPVGTLEAGVPLVLANDGLKSAIGWLFFWKMIVLIITLLGTLSIERFFCKVMCPLGAIYGLLNKVSFYRMHFTPQTCVGCKKCAHVCPMDVDPHAIPNSTECIRCGKCVDVCDANALKLGVFQHSSIISSENNIG